MSAHNPIFARFARLSRTLHLIVPAVIVGLFLLLALAPQPAAAACGGSTPVNDETGLNNAIAAFNAAAAPCVFTIQLTGNIALTASTTQINNTTAGVSLVIEAGGFTVNGQNIVGVRPFDIAANTTVTMNAIEVTGGNPNGAGGGIRNRGSLTLVDSTVTGNTAGPSDGGGGIYNSFGSGVNLTLTRTTVSNNSAGNRGGGIGNEGALTVTDSTITGNSAQSGGGVSNNVNSQVQITGSTIANNTASLDGGGVANFGNDLTIRNSTISANTPGRYGGGIYNESLLTLDSVTITDNEFSALHNADRAPAQVTIQNSILANSTNSNFDCVNEPSGTVTVVNPNLVETESNCGSFTLTSDPQLGPLQNNGGPTQTHELLAGSPAINAGDTALTTDQRGVARPQGAADDIGAYEKTPPLAVSLGYAYAERVSDGTVDFIWETATESGNAGFNLYLVAEGGETLLTPDMVPSQVLDSVTPVRYTYAAPAELAGGGDRYVIELVKVEGGSERYGPFELGKAYGTPAALNQEEPGVVTDRIYLPAIGR